MVIALAQPGTARGAGVLDRGPAEQKAPPPVEPSRKLSVTKGTREQPFWRRADLKARMKEDRDIVVSVRQQKLSPQLVRFTMAGAGWVSRPKDFCFSASQQYPRLKEVSDHFKAVEYDPGSRHLFLITEALGYQARMILEVIPVSEDWRSELQWQVVWGSFKGMTGLIGFEQMEKDRTEVSVNAKYEAEELPLPKILMGFALEVITKKVAEKMRAFIESQPALAETPRPVTPLGIAKPDPAKHPPVGTWQSPLGGLSVAQGAPPAKEDPNAEVKQPADFLKGGLASIKMPPGFSISIFAEIDGARQMALSPKGTLFVGTREGGKVFAIEGAAASSAKGEKAKTPIQIATGLNSPNGVAFHKGSLYVGEISRIIRYDNIEAKLKSPPKPAVVRDDYPKDEHHGWKYIAVGPDGWLYVPVGAPCNRCVEDDPIFASITRMSLDGKKREIYARGIRNTVGFAWHPETKQIYFTDNGADQLGDDVPADELNTAPKAGLHFGYPHCHQGDFQDPKFGKDGDCTNPEKFTKPVQKLGAHVAALGMKFYTGKQFPKEYQNRVFIAEHGSWNRSKKSGYRITAVTLDPKTKAATAYETFAEGWLKDEVGQGRPVDIVVTPDGSLLVSDDYGGVIYRIAYKKP